jgi:hypothetical protein
MDDLSADIYAHDVQITKQESRVSKKYCLYFYYIAFVYLLLPVLWIEQSSIKFVQCVRYAFPYSRRLAIQTYWKTSVKQYINILFIEI